MLLLGATFISDVRHVISCKVRNHGTSVYFAVIHCTQVRHAANKSSMFSIAARVAFDLLTHLQAKQPKRQPTRIRAMPCI